MKREMKSVSRIKIYEFCMFRLGLWSGEVDYDIFIFYVFLRSYDYNEFTFAIAGFPAYLPMFSLPKVFVETN